MVIFETPLFTQQIIDLMDDDDYASLQQVLFKRPYAGELIPETGGLRKIRWAAQNKGKRGGARIIYYWVSEHHQIFMLFAYPKNKQVDLTQQQKKALILCVKEELT
ncbi:MAG: type II toxin-antitoxin system RelE/ParE family toxin [Legionellales bacterium]|jgi:mRNA-degrading endonuclease RelE of RelBE toxin-antitoxin system